MNNMESFGITDFEEDTGQVKIWFRNNELAADFTRWLRSGARK